MSGSINRPPPPSGKHGLAALGVFAFSFGVILLYWLSILPPPEWLGLAIFVLLLTLTRRLSLPVRRLPVLVLGLLIGLSWAAWHSRDRLSHVLPGSAEGQRLSVSGYLCDVPSTGSFNSLRFSFCVTRWHNLAIEKGAGRLPGFLRLAWYGHAGEVLPGPGLRLEVVLKRPHGTLNPAGFRYEDWLFRKGYRATGSVRNVQPDPAVECSLHCRYRQLHLSLKDWVEERFGNTNHYALISSLLIGHRGAMTRQHWDVLKATGTIHLVAISGLHLGLVALGAGFASRRLLLALPTRWMGEQQARRITFTVVLVCCLMYALAAGFTVPTRRALIMVTVAGWMLLLARQSPVWLPFLAALAAVLLMDPFAPLDQGFWLSFTAVAVLIVAFSARLAGAGWLGSLLVAQIAVFAGLWPVLAVFGQGQPLAGLLANLIAIPWVSLVVMPLLIAGGLITAVLPEAANLFGPALDLVLEWLWRFLALLASWQAPAMDVTVEEVGALSVLVSLIVFAPFTGFRLVALVATAVWLVNAVSSVPQNSAVDGVQVRVWDVGQGLSVLIRHGREALVYDTGPAVPGVFSAVESTLLPNLRAEGVRRIDTLVISHADSDHAGGLAELSDKITIGRVVAGEAGIIRAQLPGLAVRACGTATETLGALTLDFWQQKDPSEGNDASCVVRVRHAGSRTEWLLPGDITGGVEDDYLAHLDPGNANSRVVIAPHHGSKTSSSEQWVRSLKPDWVIYTAGYRHRYGHPHASVTDRYRRSGAAQLNTACSGSIVMTIVDNRLALKEMQSEAPFWISGPGLTRDQCKIP